LLRPALPLAPGWAVDTLALPGLDLLPRRLREAYGIPWGPGRAGGARLIASGVRAWTSVVPTTLRSMPQARAADRRVRRGGSPTPDRAWARVSRLPGEARIDEGTGC
jgi:uncharacterized protein (DUF2236 family)